MKRTLYLLTALLLAVAMTSCKAFHTLAGSNQKTSQGRPYELIVVATQPVWTGELGDSAPAEEGARPLSPEEVFASFYARQNDAELSEDDRTYLRSLLAELEGGAVCGR